MAPHRVAVVGGGLGGLVAAGELARTGARVTLFEASQTLGGKARVLRERGFTFDLGPTLLTMPDVVRSAFERLEAADLVPRFVPLELQCDYRWRDGRRFQAHADLLASMASAERLGTDEAFALRRFYDEAERIYRVAGEPYLEAPYEGAFDFLWRASRRGFGALAAGASLGTLDGMAQRIFRTPHLRQFAGRFATYAGASPFSASAAFAQIAHLERAQGVFHPEGGLGALAEAMAIAVRRLGVEIRLGESASHARRGAELIVGPQGGEAAFDAVVVNTDPMKAMGRGDEPLSMSGYVLLVEADRRLSLAHHGIAFSNDSRAEFDALFGGEQPADGTLYVCHPAASDASMAPEGKSGLFLMLNAPALRDDGDGGWPARAPALRDWCLARVREAFPEIGKVGLTPIAERTPLDLRALGAPGGSIYGFLPHGRLGAFRRPKYRGADPRVFFAGGGTHPGGGVPLVMLSGRYAAQAVVRA